MNKETSRSKDNRPLRTLRENVGLSQRTLADKVGCPRAAITSYESGDYLPSFERAVALARALNVSLKELAKAMNIDVEGVPDDRK